MENSNRLFIIGAGFAGRALANEITIKKIFGQVVAFLDDDPETIGGRIYGIPVIGPIKDVARLLKEYPANEAIIAIPSAGTAFLKETYALLKKAGFSKIRILPAVSQILEGDAHLIQTRELDLQDLLGRDPVAIKLKQSLSYVRGKRVLVTGAGGSIGSEMCRQLLSGGAARLYLLGHGENSIYQIDRELRLLQEEGVGEKANIVPVIGELKDENYVNYILAHLKADAVFHTAAYKHVPLMEENPAAAIENNVFGTLYLINAAVKHGVRRFVHISTDKAARPASFYGASKYICEQLVLGKCASHIKKQDTLFSVVRFGNVLGSRGSIVPLFQKQIEKGGPVTVTHKDARRFFMTISEACSLVLKAGEIAASCGSGLYVLDMGEPARIQDIAEQMIRFHGYEPETEIKIEYIGLRKGECLEEKLYAEDEKPEETGHPRILKVIKNKPSNINIEKLIAELRPICVYDKSNKESYRNADKLKKILGHVINSQA